MKHRIEANCYLLPQVKCSFQCSYFHELASAERHNAEIYCAEFHRNRLRNMGNMCRNVFASVIKQ